MKIISFGWTWPSLYYGPKRCTRRDWKPEYAAQFHKDEVCQAWDKSPRIGGQRIGTIVLTDVRLEPVSEMPISDYVLEGFDWLFCHPEYIPKRLFNKPCDREDFSEAGFQRWRDSGRSMWTVRFRLMDRYPLREVQS